jgi:type IV secretion system protein VirD4
LKSLANRLAAARGTYDPFAQLREGPGAFAGFRERWRARAEAEDFGRRATAGWEEDWVMRRRGLRQGDIFLGRVPGSLRPVGIATEKHFVTIGQTGSGKSTGGLIPNLALHEGSALVIDPKGELAMITAARRGAGGQGVNGMGQKVCVLDPFRITGLPVAGYNVFDEMAAVAVRDADRPVSYAGKVAEALVKSMSDKDPYWDNAARTLLRGLILYVFQGPAESRNLVQLRRLLMEGDTAEWESQPPDVRGSLSPFDVLFEKMKRVPAGPYRDTIAAAAATMLAMGANQMGSVLTTAQEHTTFLDAPEIQRVSMASDFLLDDLKREKITVYLCLPINMVSGKEGRWLRMFVVLFIDMMMRDRQATKPPVLLAIDEFPSLGRIDGIETVAPTMRSYGVRFWAVGQDIAQFKAVYPDCWTGFIGGAEAVQFMGVTHPATVDFISERLGKHLVEGRQDGRLVRMERPLLEAEQVGRLLWPSMQNQIIWRGSRRPMKLKVTPYYEYLPAWYYSPDPRYPEAAKRARFR